MSSDYSLTEAILDSELRHINFFNGRLLTGGDLEAEQSVQHAHSRHLGEAIGEGVAFGLQVTPADASAPDGPVVSVSKGLAVNRAGQTLRLECDQRIALMRTPDPAAKDACIFDDCDPAGAGATLASGTGYYVLTIGPASRPDGKAPVSGLGNTTAICNSRFFAEGVRFRLFRLDVTANATPLARSLLASACFGLAPDISSGAWPGSLPTRYGWETLVPPGFEREREVPLAVFEWTNNGLGFLKRWPVRRRIARANAVDDWAYFTSARRVAEGGAMFLDFQEDIAALAPGEYAGDRFSLLPPGGVLPANANWKGFLGPLAPVFVTPIDASLWPRLLRDTFTREPVAIPVANAKMLGDPSFAAIKIYEVPNRAERLFARSPLGRLRIFPGQGGEELVAVVIRDANRCLRVVELVQNSNWPSIADDLPGPTAELWFLRAAKGREFLKGTSALEQAQKDVQDAEAEAASIKQQAIKTKKDLEAALKAADSGARTAAKKVEHVLNAMRLTTEVVNQSEQLRYAEEKHSRASAYYDYVRTTTQAKPDVAAAGDGLHLAPTPESWSLLLRSLRLSPPFSVKIVNGRTTDVEIPSEQPNPPGGLRSI